MVMLKNLNMGFQNMVIHNIFLPWQTFILSSLLKLLFVFKTANTQQKHIMNVTHIYEKVTVYNSI
jgi:hypothetical protein